MPTYQRGNFSIKLNFEPLDGELAESDRQLAWKVYLQIANCQAVRGYESRDGADLLDRQRMPQSCAEIRSLSRQLLEIAQQFPTGRLAPNHDDLATFLAQLLEVVLNPFLYTWDFNDQRDTKQPSPTADADSLTNHRLAEELKNDWASVRCFFRDLMGELVEKYGFVCLQSTLPQHVRATWCEQATRVASESD